MNSDAAWFMYLIHASLFEIYNGNIFYVRGYSSHPMLFLYTNACKMTRFPPVSASPELPRRTILLLLALVLSIVPT